MTKEDIQLESWSYFEMCKSRHDAKGKFILEKPKKFRKTKCPLGRKIVSSPFFRSIIYHIDLHIETATSVLENRKRDLEEFDNYVKDHQTNEDPAYRQELGREIVYWHKMIQLYKSIKANKPRWCKQGKFPWSGIKVSTPYFDAPHISMSPAAVSVQSRDTEMTPVDAPVAAGIMEFTPVTKKKKRSKAKC